MISSEKAIPPKSKERSRWEVTGEMVFEVEKYVEGIREKAKNGTLSVEKRVEFGHAIGLEGAFGTTDCSILSENGEELSIDDLKYGYTPVDADFNTQELLYAIGTIADLKKQGADISKLKTLRLRIWQPRINNYPEWEINLTETNGDGKTLLEWFIEKAAKAVELSEEAFAALAEINTLPSSEKMAAQRVWLKRYLVPSEEGCQWCKAKGFCSARAEDALKSIIAVPEATLEGLDDLDSTVLEKVPDLTKGVEEAISKIHSLPFSDLERAYAALGKIKDWCDAIATQMHAEMMAGERSPNFKLVMGREGNRTWRSENEAEELMKSMRLKVDEMYNKKVITAPQAEKALAKSKPRLWAKLEPLIGRSAAKPVIAPITDKRPSIDPYRDALDALPNLEEESVAIYTLEQLAPELEALAGEGGQFRNKKQKPEKASDVDFI